MAAIDDLIAQIDDLPLRERIAREVAELQRSRKFGLVFEHHLPELLPIYSAKPRRGDVIAQRGGSLTDTWLVLKVERDRVYGVKRGAKQADTFALGDIVVVRQFGEPIFPSLVHMDKVQNGPGEGPWHMLIEADNYHALQLLEYLYPGQVDCIYIDPPYNTRARDWKYNNDYVDANDSWRHSKWLAMMQRRLAIARRILSKDGALICTIDDNELPHLLLLLSDVFPERKIVPVTIQHNPGGTQGDQFSVTHEYALFVLSPHTVIYRQDHLDGDTYNLRRWGSTSNRFEARTCFYPIHVREGRGFSH